MGRRSISTTKSGKYMNPTDQARKEARKKELKKNKKQRQAVRTAVLKGKDPHQIIQELEKIDNMEYNVMQPPVLNEKVLKDKRKKLKETFNRVQKLYNKEDPEKWIEMKKLESEYDKRRNMMISFYESVKYAQHVQVDDIPLPTVQLPDTLPSSIPLPADMPQFLASVHAPVSGILKKTSAYAALLDGTQQCPGVPPYPPPDLSDEEDEFPSVATDIMLPMDTSEALDKSGRGRTIRFADDRGGSDRGSDSEGGDVSGEEVERIKKTKPQPTALQQKMLQMAGQDIDEFMREMEEVHKRREQDRQADLTSRLSKLDSEDVEPPGISDKVTEMSEPKGSKPGVPHVLNTLPAVASANLPGPPPLMFRPPLMRPPSLPPGVRMPPGPPPGRPSTSLTPGPPAGMPPRMTLRLPPGPPPGMPPRLLRPPGMPRLPNLPMAPPLALMQGGLLPNPNVLSAAPQLISRQQREMAEMTKKQQGATIEAKPQIRNLSADITRFLPTALRVRREDKGKGREGRVEPMHHVKAHHLAAAAVQHHAPQNKDDAYMQFMREMQGLL